MIEQRLLSIDLLLKHSSAPHFLWSKGAITPKYKLPKFVCWFFFLFLFFVFFFNGTMGNFPINSPWQVYCRKYTYIHCLTPTPTLITHTYTIICASSHTFIYIMSYSEIRNIKIYRIQVCVIHSVLYIHLSVTYISVYANIHLLHAYKHKYIHTHVNLWRQLMA